MLRAPLLASLVAVTTVTAVVPGRALAQRPTKGERERAAKARDAFDEGKRAYNLGDFDKAIDLWKQGYEYKDDPIFLFNIAQAYRQRGDHQKAIFFYRAYLREDPRARNRDDVNDRIAELSKLIEAQQSAIEAPPKGPVTPIEPTPTTPVRPDPPPARPVPTAPQTAPQSATPEGAPERDEGPPHPGRGMKIGGIVTGGVGLAAAATGVIFLLRSSSIEAELEDAAASHTPWTQELIDKESQGKSAQTIGFIGLGVGLACVLGGTTLFLMGSRKDAAARRAERAWNLVPVIGPRTAALSLTVTAW